MNTPQTREIPLSPEFDPEKHQGSLESMVHAELGADWAVTHIDIERRVAVAALRVKHHEVVDTGSERVAFRLGAGTKPSDGDAFAGFTRNQFPDHDLVSFDPYGGVAVLAVLEPDVRRCRLALATALKTKPWSIGVTAVRRADGSVIRYELKLPDSYEPKHRGSLLEVAQEVVGNLGWDVEDDPYSLTASLVAGDPPTFPALIPYPTDTDTSSWAHIPLGRTLDGDTTALNLSATPHVLCAGLTGSGKTVTVEAIIAGCLIRGFELAVLDPTKGGVDFAWAEPFCRPAGWGCESLEEALTAISIIYAEGVRRKAVLKQAGCVKWTELPEHLRPNPILCVVDECTSLFSPEGVPKGLPKTDPLVVESVFRNGLKARILNLSGKICRELRFVGVHMVMASQKFYAETISGELRANLGARILMGGSPTKGDRQLALRDPDAVPEVPAYLRSSADAVGVGVAEIEGIGNNVFKSFFASHAEFAGLAAAHAPTSDRPRPTPAQIAEHCPAPPPITDLTDAPSRVDSRPAAPPTGTTTG